MRNSNFTKIFLSGLLVWALCTCKYEESGRRSTTDSLAIYQAIPSSPVYSPQESLELIQLDKGLQLSLVAAEPLIEDPVAIDFDEEGRIWVVEMRGYMQNTDGTGEDRPVGRIKIVEDLDRDGVMDNARVIVDSLVMPRALKLVYGGLLFAEPPNLWFATIENDRMTGKILVDSTYAIGGNVEHQPNGLMMGIDNWIYSAKSSKRYRKIRDKWVVESTEFRGQWGITMDDDGTIFYNTNSNQLLGDFYPPGTQVDVPIPYNTSGIGRQIVTDQRVYPARSTPGINRGYLPEMLDDSLKLTRFTAACGPLIYRSALLGETYKGNAFVAEPAANLIKRNILEYEGISIFGKQASSNREFLASRDERFRPVNLYNSPDGALYVVDMYRGIIQHVTYLTEYLKAEIRRRELDRPVGLGRIYKITKEGQSTSFPDLRNITVADLGHQNGWIRDFAQQKLIETNPPGTVEMLKKTVRESADELMQIHAIWTLEGLDALDPQLFYALKEAGSVMKHFLLALPAEQPEELKSDILDYVLESQNPEIVFASMPALRSVRKKDSAKVFGKLIEFSYQLDQNIGADMRISLLGLQSPYFALSSSDSFMLKKLDRTARATNLVVAGFERGNQLFSQMCSVCHGKNGEGISGLGPPFTDSEWISGNAGRLAAILLYGLKGPIDVNGVTYEPPAIAPVMPGLLANKDLKPADYLELIRFLKVNFADQQWEADSELIETVIGDFGRQSTPLTASEIVNYSK